MEHPDDTEVASKLTKGESDSSPCGIQSGRNETSGDSDNPGLDDLSRQKRQKTLGRREGGKLRHHNRIVSDSKR
ncbi:hypothetical protein JZ751_018576 [Albula glossodonta]|uniref:Uncharacterized protein n=1 Tax=Albula glossodonta TaxID=121402 RepID=A0A8T2NW93_9TELE|nr:hypothetical protein JZ751_018576 [Albula glossodonta]